MSPGKELSPFELGIVEAYAKGHISRLVADSGVDETVIRRWAKKAGVEARPMGRPPMVPSKRAVAMGMFLDGKSASYIASPTVLHTGEKSLYRIKHRALRDETGLRAVGTIIENPNGDKWLIHREIYPNKKYEKYQGSNSIQLSWRGSDETDYQAVLRMIKSEVYGLAGGVIEKWQLPEIIEPKDMIKDEMLEYANIMVADVLVKVYRFRMTETGLRIPFSSRKVENIHWAGESEIEETIDQFRSGAREALIKYFNHDNREEALVLSDLNIQLKNQYLQAQI